MRRYLVALVLCCLPFMASASVTSVQDKSGPFIANGGFPQVIGTQFAFQQSTDIQVLDYGSNTTPRDPATVLVLNSDYSVTGGGYNTQNQMQAGSISLLSGVSAIVAGDQIVIRRNAPINQISSFTYTGPNTAVLLEQALDKMATLSQQVNEIGSRSLQFENFELLNPTLSLSQRKGMLLGFDLNGNIQFYPSSNSGGGGGTGTVTSVATGAGLTGGPISTTGTVAVDFTYGGTYTGLTFWRTASTPDSFIGAPNWQALDVSNPSTTSGTSFGLEVNAGTSASDWAFEVTDSTGLTSSAHTIMLLDGAGQMHLSKFYSGSAGYLAVDTSGNITVGSGGGGGGSAYPTSALNLAALRALSPTGWVAGTVVTLSGYYNPGDGGGGDFAWQPSDTTTDNSGTLIKLTGTATGRLHRIIPGSNGGSQLRNTTVDVRWFGAIPDGVMDCAPAVELAEASFQFASSNQNGALYFPAGVYNFQTACVLTGSNTGALRLKGDGDRATIFLENFTSGTPTALLDLENTPYISVVDIGFSPNNSTVTPTLGIIYAANAAFLTLERLHGNGLTGTFINVNTIGAWSRLWGIDTQNVSGAQILVNGSGGVISHCNLGNNGSTAGTLYNSPCVVVQNCNSLNIADSQLNGAGPYKKQLNSSITASSGSSFTVTTPAPHGWVVGDYVYLATATSHAGYVNRWQIQTVPTSNTFTVASAANLGTDTGVDVTGLWSELYFGGGALNTESTFENCLVNTAGQTPPGACGIYVDGYNGNQQGLKFNKMYCDYGRTAIFMHGIPTASFDGVNSYLNTVVTSNAYQFTAATASGTTNDGSMVVGHVYVIQSVGTSNFTSYGAASNTVGTVFTASGVGGSGTGVLGNVLNHEFRAGGYIWITGGTYAGFWKISAITSNTITVYTTVNLGTSITVPLEGATFSSSCGGNDIALQGSNPKDDFGGIRLEGADNIIVTAPRCSTGGNNLNSTLVNAVVISDGDLYQTTSYPVVDIGIKGGTLVDMDQAQHLNSNGSLPTIYGVTIDGTYVYSVEVKNALITSNVTAPFNFTRSATPNTCNLDTDYFRGWTCIVQPTGSQTFTSGTNTGANWVPVNDPHGMWNGATPGQINLPSGARYAHANWNVFMSGNLTTSSQFYINGTGMGFGATASNGSLPWPSVSLSSNVGNITSTTANVTAGGTQNSGGTLTLSQQGNLGYLTVTIDQ